MQSLIFKSLLSVGIMVLFAGDCNPTPGIKSEDAFFKQIAFTAHNVKYDFHLTPAPGTLSINDQSVNLANAQQTASGATLVVDGKTYGIAYKNINDTVYLTLTLPDDVESLPTSITLNTLSVSEKSTLVDQNGASITEGQSLSRRNDAFIAKIISEDGKKNTIYNIKLEQSTLHLQVVSYSGGTFETVEGKEMPVLGIAIEDNILTDESMLISVSGLQSNVMYQYQIGTDGDKQDIVSSSTGEIELKKSHLKNGDDISIKEDEDIMLYSASANLLEIIARYKKYEIHDWKDLQGMRMDLDASYTLENDIELPSPGMGGLPKEGFDPIGTSMTAFTGSFAGESRMISKFSINRPEKDHVGLFGYIKSELTEVKDVKIAISDSVHGRNYVGGVVGHLRSGTITGVEVTGGKVSGNNNVGGVAGANSESGVVGQNYREGTITNSYATGDVSGNSNIGGVAGANREGGTITNSYATGDVSGTGDNVGGVAGHTFGGTITNSYATGDVSGNNWVGGVAGSVGELTGGGVPEHRGTITNSYATGDVYGNNFVGGITGLNYGTITNSYATGDVSGNSYVGGVAGNNNVGTITNSYATGDVSGNSNIGGVAGDNINIGGVAGDNIGGVTGNHISGKITNSYALGGVSRKDGSEMTLNWVVGLNYAGSVTAGRVADSYYPYRGDNAIDGVNAHDPSADSVKKDVFEKLKKESITGQKGMYPFNGWNFDAKNGDWEWVSETNQKDLHNREALLWPLLRLATGDNIPSPSGDFVTKFRDAQINGQRDALEVLNKNDVWQ